jgi:hypothetical protein
MLNRSLSYKTLLRIGGFVLIVCGFFFAWRTAYEFIGAGDNVTGAVIDILGPFGGSFPSGGALIYVGLGLFFLGVSSMRVRLAYWSLQLAVWLIGINLWYQQNGETNLQLLPLLVTPLSFWPQMTITLICSLVLLVLYIPLVRLFRKLFETKDEKIVEPATSSK